MLCSTAFATGTDLIKVANGSGEKLLVVIETNSCPSGVKSMPKALRGPNGFQSTIERSFAELLGPVSPDLGGLAVVYDINAMEANAYAAAMAEFFGEKVFLAEFHRDDPDPPIRWVDGLMEVRDAKGGEFRSKG